MSNKKLLLVLAVVAAGALLWWRYTAWAVAPPCTVQANWPPANAGCAIVHQGKMLVARQRNGLVNIPGGSSAPGESAQCTAQRETWEETGLVVQVGPLFKKYDNNFHLFHCTITDSSQPNPQDRYEISEAYWVAAPQLPEQRWRFAHELGDYQQLLRENAAEN